MNADRLTEYLDTLTGKGIPSFDCIVYRDHKMIYRHMGGAVDAAGEQQIRGDEAYLMFSMTKIMTMCCIMQLVEQGRVSLDDPVSRFLPAYGELTYVRDGEVLPVGKPMLIRHLVSMQSGLDYDLSRPGILRVLKEKGDAATTLELVNSFVESPLKFIPGERFLYSLSHDVIAAVIEVVSGMSFGEYMRRNIWEPLGLKNTYFAKPMNDGTPRLGQQFICNPDGRIVPMEQSCCYQLSAAYESGGAGLISTIEDYAILGDAIACGGTGANGACILRPETVERIKVNLLGEASINDLERNMGRFGYGYGCGMSVMLDPARAHSAAPAGVFGWDGAAGSCLTMDTASKLSFTYAQHVRSCGMAYGEIHPAIRDIVFGD